MPGSRVGAGKYKINLEHLGMPESKVFREWWWHDEKQKLNLKYSNGKVWEQFDHQNNDTNSLTKTGNYDLNISSVSHSVVSDSLWPHGLQYATLPCPSPTPGAYSNSCPSPWWCHPTISSSAVPFSSCLQSFPASGSFPMSQFFVSGGQSIGVSASTSILLMNIQDWFPLGWTGLISL